MCIVWGDEMVFNSLDYLFFFAIVTLLYYLIPQRKRYILLLVAGCIFYMCWNVGNIIVLLYIIVITYTAGQLLDRSFTTKSKKMICALTGLFSFGVLQSIFATSSQYAQNHLWKFGREKKDFFKQSI